MKLKNILMMSAAAMLLGACGIGNNSVTMPSNTPNGQGNMLAQANQLFAKGDVGKAVSMWTALADKGDAAAQFQLSQAYRAGKGVTADKQKALDYLIQSAKGKYVPAIAEVGRLNLAQKNYQEAAKLLQFAAQKGNPSAQYDLGIIMMRGQGVKKDFNTGLQLLQAAAQQGFAPAQMTAGVMLLQGKTVQKNEQAGAQLIQAAAQQGYAPAVKLIQQIQSKK